jgi:hypothetical protein
MGRKQQEIVPYIPYELVIIFSGTEEFFKISGMHLPSNINSVSKLLMMYFLHIQKLALFAFLTKLFSAFLYRYFFSEHPLMNNKRS